ncbi:hypothetical protein C8Q78DRAFT_1077313 [Trametes maxima]|nr:hypothetical protein C8Q78DRAFT_1077313 [Trametes maxima]
MDRDPPPPTQFFDDAGSPIGRGCPKGGECNFVHPSHPYWDRAAKSRNRPLPPKSKGPPDRRDSASAGGWGQPRAGWDDRRGGNDRASGARDGPPSAPRKQREDSGWGMETFGGTAFGAGGDAGADARPIASSTRVEWGAASGASSSAAAPPLSTTEAWGAPGVGWDAPSSGGWGFAANESSGRGSSPAVGWGDPTAAQKSPDGRSGGGSSTWGDSNKGKQPEAAPTPTWDTATPRTPRSPPRSPQREHAPAVDPRRRPSMNVPQSRKIPGSAVAPMSASEEAALANEGPKEETRILSYGVSAPIAVAGPSGASSSKPNPFAFPAYNPPERMAGITTDMAEGQVREINMAEGASDSSRVGSRAQSRASSPVPTSPLDEGPPSTTTQWQKYVRALTRAVSLNIELGKLKETRARQRQLQHSQAFKSASLAVAHARIDEIRKDHEAKLRRTEKRLEDYIGKLAQFPQDGPSGTVDSAVPPEVRGVEQWVEGVNAWMESVRPFVQQYEDAVRAANEARAEREAEAEAESRRQEERRSRVAALAARVDGLEETMTELELQMEEMRIGGPPVEDVVSDVLGRWEQQMGIRLPDPDVDADAGSGRSPPKTEAEVAEEYARLEQALAACVQGQAATEELVKEQKARNVAKSLVYHHLAGDQAQMQLQLTELFEQHKAARAMIEANRDELDALQRALQAHKDQEPPPPPPPMTLDELAAHILPLLRPELRAALHEGLAAVRAGVDAALAKSQEQLCMQILAVARPAMRLIQTVKTMADRQPEILMPPPPPPVQSMQHS